MRPLSSEYCVRLELPFPPTLNHNVGVNGKGRYLTREYKTFIEAVGWEWLQRRPRKWNVNARYCVGIMLFYGSRRRYDIDDRVKPILDALTRAGVWEDDWQVDHIDVHRGEIDAANPRAEVGIYVYC